MTKIVSSESKWFSFQFRRGFLLLFYAHNNTNNNNTDDDDLSENYY